MVFANKNKNTDKFAQYKADFYSRGLFKVKNLPKKFLGQEIDDMGGGLDSTRSGLYIFLKLFQRFHFKKTKEF